ncbi:MAG: pilus assembly protein TadG-related protein [Acidimicrobiales bacterium]
MLMTPAHPGHHPSTPSPAYSPVVTEGEASKRDRGAVAVWFALSLTVLLGMAGFGTDLARLYLTASRAQNAADAAAMAGVVFMPANFTQARSTAITISANHGFSAPTVTTGASPNQIRVTTALTVNTSFVKLLGVPNFTVRRTALAEYEQPVAMGSPDPNLGNDPDNNILPQYWLNISGPQTDKSQGERYGAKPCGASGATEFCTTATTPNNAEYSTDGYFFGVRGVAGQTLRIQLWDAAYYPGGLRCNAGPWPSAAERTTLQTWYPDASTRYAGEPTTGTAPVSKWCTGDVAFLGTSTAASLLARTSVVVRAPDITPWTDNDNPIISTCSKHFPGFPQGTSAGTNIYRYLHPSDGVADAQAIRNPTDGVYTFAETFRQWATVCDIPAAVDGDYIVQIRANASALDPTVYDASVSFEGQNHFSMRVGQANGANGVTTTGYNVYARGRLPIFANASGTTFKAARVLPGASNRTLQLNLFDIGDVASGGSLSDVLYFTPSPDVTLNGSPMTSFSGCVFRHSGGVALTGANPSNCSLAGVVSSIYQGKIVTVEIPIPNGYGCNTASATGCWVNVLPSYVTAVPTDATTWSATMIGTPVRLVQ